MAGLAGLALERLWRWPRRPVAALGAVLLAAAFVAEYRPARLDPSPVRRLALSATLQSELNRSRFLLVVPRRDYRNVHDTWAVTLDMRSVHLSFVGREIAAERGLRESLFPRVYLERPRPQDPAFLSELHQLDVGYVLFESDSSPRPAWGREIAREGETSLWSLRPGSLKQPILDVPGRAGASITGWLVPADQRASLRAPGYVQ